MMVRMPRAIMGLVEVRKGKLLKALLRFTLNDDRPPHRWRPLQRTMTTRLILQITFATRCQRPINRHHDTRRIHPLYNSSIRPFWNIRKICLPLP